MTFLAPWALLGLVLVPVLGVLYLLAERRRARRAPAAFGIVDGSGQTAVQRRRHVPPALFLGAAALLLLSLARPETSLTLPTRTGQIVLAFDTSNSMLATDAEPTRLAVAKQIAIDFTDRQPGSIQLGVVGFTNGGLVVQQPTKTRADVIDAIERLTTDGGTSIGEGIFASLTAIADEPIVVDPEIVAVDIAALDIGFFSNAAIIVFTDGEEIGGADPLELAGLASNAGVPVYTVGVGSPRGTIVDLDGFSIATSLDEPLLTEIAESTGGQYFRAVDDPELAGIFDAIDRNFERQGERIEVTAIVALLAVALLLAAAGLSMRWFGRVI